MSKLTEITCKTAKPREKAYKLFDGGGLYLEITPTGSKLWRLKFRSIDGKEKRASFGSYPLITLKEAREKRDEAKRLILEGKDPVQEKHKKRAKAIEEENNTFEKIAREWHKLHEPEWTPEHAKTIINRLEKDVFPIIGKTPIKKLTHKNLLDLAKSIQQRGANELAKRVIQMSRHIFQYAIITGRADRNLAEDLRGLIKAKPKKHFASLDIKELPEFLQALYTNEARLMPLTHLAVQFMMLTFVRTGEMIKAEWSEFDFEENMWLIPAQRMKMNKDHLVPLSGQALDILQKIRDQHTNQTYVFPSRGDPRNHMSNNTILMALRRMGYQGQMTGHGFRSLAMSTIMEKLGYSPDGDFAWLRYFGFANIDYARQALEQFGFIRECTWARDGSVNITSLVKTYTEEDIKAYQIKQIEKEIRAHEYGEKSKVFDAAVNQKIVSGEWIVPEGVSISGQHLCFSLGAMHWDENAPVNVFERQFQTLRKQIFGE